ncbi:MAG: HlyC/CorC family transporter [Clostridia bacterium]|nr:HlyC/CorC family transporter [Clostridia bacterium]
MLSVQFTLTDGLLIISLIILLSLSAFFSASETAFSTANIIRIRNYADEKVKGARKALWVMEHYDKTLSTILVGNNFVNIASTTLCAIIFGKFILNPTLANILNTVIMTIIVLIFGEICPKSLAKANAEKFALKFAGVMFFLVKVLTPITYPFYALQKAMLKRVKADENPTVTEDELESIIDTMEEEGVLDSEDADLIQGVMDLDTQTVYDIMTPRIDVVAIDVKAEIEELKDKFLESGFSRIPVYNEDKDHMIGIVHQKDYFKSLLSNKKFSIKSLMTEPIYVAENMKANDLIRKMQQDKKHMAIVIDEHGGTSGIVTFEDAVEEMLGDIYDEHDDEVVVSYITKQEDNVFDVNPDINLEELFETLEIEHMPETEYTTLGGYLYELAENLPELNQVLEVVTVDEQMDEKGEYITKTIKLSFTISEIEDRSIKKVKLLVEPTELEPEKHLKHLKKKDSEEDNKEENE